MSLTKKRILLAGPLAVLGIGLSVWRYKLLTMQAARYAQTARHLLRAGRANDALSVIHSAPVAQSGSAQEREMLDMEVTALETLRASPQLLDIYDQHPEAFLVHEEAASLVARAMLQMNDRQGYDRLKAGWEKRIHRPELWLTISADQLLHEGNFRKAQQTLLSAKLVGKADAERLLRLALMDAKQRPQDAWNHLQEAYKANPHDPEVRSFRAQVLEARGQYGAARVEYVAALLAAPKNPLMWDQLAEFYRRRGLNDMALQTWAESLDRGALDYMWLKSLFWSRLIGPMETDKARGTIAEDGLHPLARFVHELAPDTFWDNAKFNRLAKAAGYERRRQEVFWLKTLQLLKQKQEDQAFTLLKSDPWRAQSIAPEIANGLLAVLQYRRNGHFYAQDLPRYGARFASSASHAFFQELASYQAQERQGHSPHCSKALQRLLRGNEAFTAVCLAAGWREAALHLRQQKVLPADSPEWLAYGLMQSLRMNRGNSEALAFARRQPSSSSLTLLIGETQIAAGDVQNGLQTLGPLSKLSSDVGYRAALLLGLAAMEQGHISEAEKRVRSQPRLAASSEGGELLARAALLQGRVSEAESRYARLRSVSLEAQTYFTRKAFVRKDYTEAKRLTLAMLERNPDELALRRNLLAIEAARRRQ